MSYQDGIDNIRSRQGLANSIDPNYLADQMQLMKGGSQGQQVIYESYVNQIPTVDEEPIVIQFEVENPYRPGTDAGGKEWVSVSSGILTPKVNGAILGHIDVTANRTGGGQGVATYVWMEIFWSSAQGGDDTWRRFGGIRSIISFQDQPIDIERNFSIFNARVDEQYRFMFATADATGEGIGLYTVAEADIEVNAPPPVTGLSSDVSSAELNMFVYDFGVDPAP